MCLQFFVHCAAFSFFVITRAFSAFVALLYSSLLVFFIDFFVYFLLRFSHITHTPRVCVCSGNQATDQTRPVLLLLLLLVPACLWSSAFVQLSAPRLPSHLTPPPPPQFFTPPTCIGGRPLRLLLQPPMLDTRVSRVFIMPRTRVQGDGGRGDARS